MFDAFIVIILALFVVCIAYLDNCHHEKRTVSLPFIIITIFLGVAFFYFSCQYDKKRREKQLQLEIEMLEEEEWENKHLPPSFETL